MAGLVSRVLVNIMPLGFNLLYYIKYIFRKCCFVSQRTRLVRTVGPCAKHDKHGDAQGAKRLTLAGRGRPWPSIASSSIVQPWGRPALGLGCSTAS